MPCANCPCIYELIPAHRFTLKIRFFKLGISITQPMQLNFDEAPKAKWILVIQLLKSKPSV